MTDSAFIWAEAAILAACLLWACSLAFIRNQYGWSIPPGAKKQIMLFRLAAVVAFACALRVCLNWAVVPGLALCVMLLSLNSIMLAFVIGLRSSKK